MLQERYGYTKIINRQQKRDAHRLAAVFVIGLAVVYWVLGYIN